MSENQIFKSIWKFNAVVIMIAGIAAIGLALFSCMMIFKEFTRDRSVRNIVNIEKITEKEGAEKATVWELGHINPVRGSDFIMVPLHSKQRYSRGSYRKSASSVRNYLYFNSNSNEKYWLFGDNNQLIAETKQLPQSVYGDESKETLAILYTLIKLDTNGDKVLTTADLQTLAISKPDGTKYTELFKEIEFLNGYKVNSSGSILVIYQRNSVGYSASVNLSTFAISNEAPLPKVQP